jgi:hypothetical protein
MPGRRYFHGYMSRGRRRREPYRGSSSTGSSEKQSRQHTILPSEMVVNNISKERRK